MSLVTSIALTHLRARLRQTLVGMMGVATGVGFSVMMAGLMEGSQNDFINQLVDSLPHITISDEQRAPSIQPATQVYDAAQIRSLGLQTERPGIRNPYAILAGLEAWVPGEMTPSVQSKVILRYAGRDTAASLVGIDPRREPRVSKLATHLVDGSLSDLYRASSAVILGDGLARKIGVRVGNTVSMTTGQGRSIGATVVGLVHAGIKQSDDTMGYTLIRTGQVLGGQIGLVNEIRLRLDDVMQAREVASRIEAQIGYKTVSWQEAHEDLLSAFQIRNLIMFTVVGAILLVASFGTYNIVSTITHEKTRDIAIMKSLGLPETTVRRIFVLEAALIGLFGMLLGWALGYLMCLGLGTIEIRTGFTDNTRLPILYSPVHYLGAGAIAVASSLFAGYFPARKAASLHPVEIIRGAS
jgi:lipoprotein-releasing system permease protein